MERLLAGALRFAGRQQSEMCDKCIWFEFDDESERCINRYELCCILHVEEHFSSANRR